MHSARAVFYTLKASVYICGIVKAVNKAQAETNFRLSVYFPTKKMSGRGGEKSEQGQGFFRLRKASAAGNTRRVLSRRSTPYKRKRNFLKSIKNVVAGREKRDEKECRVGAGKFRVKGKNVFVCTRRSAQAILGGYCQGTQQSVSGNRLALLGFSPHRPD